MVKFSGSVLGSLFLLLDHSLWGKPPSKTQADFGEALVEEIRSANNHGVNLEVHPSPIKPLITAALADSLIVISCETMSQNHLAKLLLDF